jgi:uncharacterized protein with FMN-binding domain
MLRSMAEQRPKRPGARKLQTVALSSAAIATVYAIGWAATRPDAPSNDQVVRLLPGQHRPVRAGLRPPVPPGHYSDGTWTGAASNAYGEVEVAVRIQGGRIAAARITRTTTFYPVSLITGLPAQVVERQSADVDVVSGATASWQDFANAVQQALTTAAGKPWPPPREGS